MRIAPAVATLAALLSLAAPTLACGVDLPVRQPQLVTSGGDAQRLLRAAAEAEANANRREITARAADRRAAQLESQATLTLTRADQVFGRERAQLLASAANLLDRADDARDEAAFAFQDAASFRDQARNLRERARIAVGGSNPRPWRTARVDPRLEI